MVVRRAGAGAAAPEGAGAPAPAGRVEPVLTAAATAAVVTSMVPEGDGVAEADSAAETEFEEGTEETRPA
ncbi:MAG: hypothetical protein JJ869_11750 [Marivita sp.]|nr:hypothetical protein [Marivita sp.]